MEKTHPRMNIAVLPESVVGGLVGGAGSRVCTPDALVWRHSSNFPPFGSFHSQFHVSYENSLPSAHWNSLSWPMCYAPGQQRSHNAVAAAFSLWEWILAKWQPVWLMHLFSADCQDMRSSPAISSHSNVLPPHRVRKSSPTRQAHY